MSDNPHVAGFFDSKLTPECAEPEAPVFPCACCKTPVKSCEKPDGPDHRCPAHPDGIEDEDGRWFCSQSCWYEVHLDAARAESARLLREVEALRAERDMLKAMVQQGTNAMKREQEARSIITEVCEDSRGDDANINRGLSCIERAERWLADGGK